MSYVPPPPPGVPEGHPGGPQPRPKGKAGSLAGGVALGFVGSLFSPVPGVFVAGAIGGRVGGWLTVLGPVVLIGVAIWMLTREDLRMWGAGLLMGFALALIVAAGACVLLLATVSGSGG
ncbi:MAG: hypothetical protein ACXVW2_08500 [Nocardioidaceae bacterium]